MNESHANPLGAYDAATRHLSLVTRHPSKGSVLAFCVVILCVLAMLGVTFLLTVQQASRAAHNALGPIQADMAAQAGLNHAQAILSTAYSQQVITTPDGVFALPATATVPAVNPYKKTDGNPDTQGPASVSYLSQFAGGSGASDSALLSADDATERQELRYTNTPLRISGLANRNFLLDDATKPLLDRAHRWGMQGAMSDFFPPIPVPAPRTTSFTELAPVGSVRGAYHVWIEDLDAKLHVMPDLWGMDDLYRYLMSLPGYQPNQTMAQAYVAAYQPYSVQPVYHPTQTTLQGPDTLNVPAPSPGPGFDPQRINLQPGIINRLNILLRNPSYLNNNQGGTNTFPSSSGPLDVSYIVSNQPTPQQAYDTMGEFFLNLQTLTNYADALPPNSVAYEDLRTTLQYYFKAGCLNDAPRTPFAAALNINTAPVEVIEAALLEIPAWDRVGAALNPPNPDATLTFGRKIVSGNVCLANWLAVRIVAKRPFLCRMDFEDFVAAQLPGYINDPTNDPTHKTPLGAIDYAILKRGVDPTNASSSIELTLHQYLEIPGKSQAPPTYATYAALLSPAAMETRFQVFANDTGVDAVAAGLGLVPTLYHHRNDGNIQSPGDFTFSVLDIKDLNNLLNSVSHNAFNTIPSPGNPKATLLSAGDDRQITAPGEKGVLVIHPGANGQLDIPQTSLGGDDIIGQIIVPGTAGALLQTTPVYPDQLITEAMAVPPYSYSYIVPATGSSHLVTTAKQGDALVQAVLSGLNGIAETSIFGYSYYSHDSATQEYMPARLPNLYPNPYLPQSVGKFVYHSASDTKEKQSQVTDTQNPPHSQATSVMNYEIADLQQWSCIGNGERYGYYDMFFNTTDIMRMYLGEQEPPQPPTTPPATPNPHRVCVESSGTPNAGLHTGWGCGGNPYNVATTPSSNNVTIEVIELSNDANPSSGTVYTNRTSVWGPLRASQRWGPLDSSGNGSDQLVTTPTTPPPLIIRPPYSFPTPAPVQSMVLLSADQIPSAVTPAQPPISWTAVTPPQPPPAGTPVPPTLYGNSDVSWSPQFTFRSRFFGIYVLGRGLQREWVVLLERNLAVTGQVTTDPALATCPSIYPGASMAPGDVRDPVSNFIIPGQSGVLKSIPVTHTPPAPGDDVLVRCRVVGERRLEAVYDAMKDEIIWQRAPATEKRSLADP